MFRILCVAYSGYDLAGALRGIMEDFKFIYFQSVLSLIRQLLS